MNLVAPLDAIGGADLARAGGKGANLGELVRNGFPVPPGFAVLTSAYALAVESAPELRLPARPGESDGAAIRAGFAALPVPERIRTAIGAAYADLGGGPVAVRSSATAEDLPGAAFAGQQDTYLNVVGLGAVVDAVRDCWGSLWTDRAIAYRARLGIDSTEVRIAVVVQRMVPAEVAGVMFTADPVSGERGRFVVDASGGLGEAVVSGLVSPDRYVLDRRGRVREWAPGRREVVIRGAAGGGVVHDTAAAGGGAGHDPAADDHRLPDPVLADLAGLGARVEAHFGRPQDIEFAYQGGRLWLLQARPMTALPPPPERLNPVRRKLGAILLEYLPYRPYPIDVTTWLPYGPAGLMARMTAYFGVRNTFEDFLRERDGVVEHMVAPSPRPTLGVLRAPVRVARLARRYDPARWTEDPRFAEFVAGVRELADQDPAALSWPGLVELPRRTLALVGPMADLRIDYLPRSGLSLLRAKIVLAVLRRGRLSGKLVLAARTRTADANQALETLAERARSDRRLLAAVVDLDPNRLAEFPSFQAELTAFLAEYGHRESVTPLLATSPTWGESPRTVLGLIKVLAGTNGPASSPAASSPAAPVTAGAARAGAGTVGDGAAGDTAVADLLDHPWLRGRRIRAAVGHWIRQARAGVAFREDSHFHFTRPLPILRRALLEIGRRLSDAGVLTAPEEVYHLRLEEIEQAGDPARLGQRQRDDLRSLVRARAARRAELAGVRLLDPGLVFPRPDGGDVLVAGTPASGGTVTGRVRVIHAPDGFGTLRAGEVLVCPYTNPSWTPLFQRAAAVVVDTGGLASHAAIVAREYGLPAIMGTATGTTVLVDGQLVTVDGDTGRVVDGATGRVVDGDTGRVVAGPETAGDSSRTRDS